MYFNEALKEYERFILLELKAVTAKGYIHDLKSLCIYTRNCRIDQVTDNQVTGFLTFLQEIGYQYNGVAKKAMAYRNFWKWLNKKGIPSFFYDLIPCMDFEWTPKRVATEENYQKLLSVIPEKGYCHIRDRAIVMLLWDTGARRGEILSINESDLNLVDMKTIVKTEKSRGKRPFREVHWKKETNEALKKWLEVKHLIESSKYIEEPKALFWGSTNNYQGRRLTGNAVGTALRKYSDLAKIPSFNPHSARHRFGHELSKKGANNSIISSMLGHSDLRSSYVYTEMNNKENQDAYDKYMRNS
jgi:Site-specific recombinase XerD